MRHRRNASFVLFVAISLVAAASACAIGEFEEPGCQTDADCGDERICRAGACFRLVGDLDATVPTDDAG
jgi:hypothetical protein